MRARISGSLVAVLLMLPLMAATLDTAKAQDELGMTRPISYVASVDPPTMVLEAEENLYPKNMVLDAKVVFVPDRRLPGLGKSIKLYGGSIIGNLEDVTRIFVEGLRNEIPSQQKTLEKYWGSKLNLKGEIWNFKDAASELRNKGFAKGGSRVYTLNGKKYQLTRWTFRTETNRRAMGTVTGIAVLNSQPNVDSKSHKFSANFKLAGGLKFPPPYKNLSIDENEFQSLYNDFKIRFAKRVNRVQTFLNRKRKMLKKSQMEAILDAPAFQAIQFKRQTGFPWYGKRRIMRVRVSVTPGKRNINYVDRPLGEPAFD